MIYTAGLTPPQEAAFTQAVAQWAPAARFQVSYTSSPAAADVTVTGAPLGGAQPGTVEDGYTTVSYRCDPGCTYDSARVELSTSANLAQTDWGLDDPARGRHVAGLNHVSKVAR